MSENYEWFAIATTTLLRFSKERELQSWLRTYKHLGKATLFRRPLGSHLLRLLRKEKRPLPLVLQGQLFLENIVDAIIARKFTHSHLVLKNHDFSAAMKVDLVRARNLIDSPTHNDISIINKVRNRFAHDLFYDFARFDATAFSYCEGIAEVYHRFSTRQSREAVNVYIVKWVLHWLLVRLTKRHAFIADITMGPSGVA